LKAAHDQGVVHRDLKPANLMFPPAAGGGFHVKVTDFGIAKLFGETGHTRSGMVIGTPEYMPPEQATGLAVDHRADLYSLGLVMFAMLAGKPPFQGSVPEVLECQRTRRPPRIAAVVPDVPGPLDDLIDNLLAKAAADRPANATVVARRLAEIAALPLQPTIEAPPVPPQVPGPTIAADAPPAGPAAAPAPAPPSTFTTVEAAARAVREREEAAAGRRSAALLAASFATITAIAVAGWWLLLRPWPWPDPGAEQRHYVPAFSPCSETPTTSATPVAR
jgi:eukaryotic-like serine/threonine-protein kinase